MLSLMCDSFGLPFSAARDLFYKDPYFDVEKKRVLVVDGEIASCLTIVEAPMWIGAAVVRVAGIAGVATASQHRRKGYASRLLLETLPAIRQMGCPFAALFPFSYDYYHKLGWARVGSQLVTRVPRSSLPPFREARNVRAAHPADRADVAALYERTTRGLSGRWIRDDRRWGYLLEHAKSQVVYRKGLLGGYALFETRDEQEGERTARILELYADSEEASRGLVGYFAGMKDVRTISYTGPVTDSSGAGLVQLAEIGAASQPSLAVEPGVMFRIVDFPSALAQLSPNLARLHGEHVLTMTDSLAPREWPRGAIVTADGTAISVQPLEYADPRQRSPDRIESDVRAWTQVLTGHHSLDGALSLNLLHRFGRTSASSGDAATGIVNCFPRRDLFVPPADHF